ncbi:MULTISPECIES: site-specific integrase [Vibrio]|uniref:site-specific integrase n=1 Tax=Vibrio TaxID=662 RepID=UPI000C82CBF1|nr:MULTISPECIES: site-specific integrase [Vibrio]PMJ63849.1 hypothetical protein BCU18_17790 [Vibrio lentus]
MSIKYLEVELRVDGTPVLSRDESNNITSSVNFDTSCRTIKSNILYDSETGLAITPVNLFLIDLIADPAFMHENNLTTTKGLKAYFQFLKDNGCCWNVFPRSKLQRPTYAFKRHVMDKVKNGDYSFDTGNQWLGAVKRFYLWAFHERVLDISDINQPFVTDTRRVEKHTASGKKRFYAATSDMKLPQKLRGISDSFKRNGGRELKPINALGREQFKLGLAILGKPHMVLASQVSLLMGLRENEALTLPYSFFTGDFANANLSARESVVVSVGGNEGTKTKNGVRRIVEIPFALYERLCDYATSDKRLALGKKFAVDNPRLFLNNRGTPFRSDELTKRMSELRQQLLQEHGVDFNHKYHDLRATFATEYGTRLLDRGMKFSAVFNEVKSILGHKLDKDTFRYMSIIESQEVKRESAMELELYTQEILKD